MKKTTFILATLLGLGNMSGAAAQNNTQDIIPGVSVNDCHINRNGKYLTVEMEMGLTGLEVNPNAAVLITPRLVNGADSLDLPSVGVYGRRRYYYYLRNGESTISGDKEKAFRASEKPETVEYNDPVIYKKWMDGATLKLHRSDWGCCREMVAEYQGALGTHHEKFFPELVFVQPKAEVVKVRSLYGSAYIDFPVNQTVIDQNYRRNTVELGKIQASIDSVRNDRDVTITSVWLKGYASPESPYKHNTELAIGRTDALKRYIGNLYHFGDGIISTDYEPEDWAGLRRLVEGSGLKHKEEILVLIDSELDPDEKEKKIKNAYPEDYRFMLQNFYPALRHTDYRIDYTIRVFGDAEEISRVMAERPQNLSLNEFYLVAGKYEPGTYEFTNVFQTAVHMFPNDEIANLNAANAAIRRDDFEAAHRYLDKAGDSAEAVYAHGALAVREENYETALMYLEKAVGMGLRQATHTLEELKKRIDK